MQRIMDMHRDLLTTGDVATQLGVSHQWVRDLIRSGRLRAIRTPLGFLVAPESLDEYQSRGDVKRRYRVAY